MDADAVLEVLRAFAEEGVRYKVVGAVALNLLGLPRATEDLDVFVAPDEDNINRLKAALRSVFDDPEIDGISAADLQGSYSAIQYVPPEGTFYIDILTRLGEAFAYDDIQTEEREVEGVRVAVATPAMLYRMKKDTVRLQDRADAERLSRRFNLSE
ncbi:MAG: nucleotidyl transferase AbiEii/AbiGii toxin family protein [Deltaproteobacteria bacterium]|nr:nucleotidyl transferase AbiEii/AbiGii toxin family protein [Deltaproteobacteria bacterium]